MRFVYAIAFLAASFTSTNSFAQFGGLLNQLKSEVEKNLPKPSNSAGLPKTQSMGKPKVMSSEEFCNKLKNSQELNEFAASAKKLATQHNLSYVFDTKDNLIANWIQGKLNPMLNIQNSGSFAGVNEFIFPSEASANECALSIRDSDLLYLMASNQNSYEKIKTTLDKIAQVQSPQTVRKMDASGNIINETMQGKNQPINAIGAYSGKSSISKGNGNGITPDWLVTWLILLDENGQILKNTYPEIKATTIERIARLERENMESKEKFANEKKQEIEANAKQEREQQAVINKYKEFRNSPDGQLIISYQYYQVLQTCNEIRKGYAIQFVNDTEFSAATKNIKAIEASLKPSLKDKNTDKLWSNAIERNKKWNPSEESSIITGLTSGFTIDLIDTIKTNNKLNWVTSQKDCSQFLVRFNGFSESVLGTEAPKKAF
ncbi:hypothetical protein [Limnohabitans sp. B9-3]|uniref:hypothetical protein n=1 Tax=Limnohabitans sp. B9-3 TaxID=1100707 RepID=UPI000C1E75DF|nr:hypothetical protein [Limnohabitans sp. B9-3]PIT71213.1 hypothetical protein B9Z42_16085 [Limnohabitans sp. B9-3]